MAVYNTLSGNKLRIDKGYNTFVNGKCVNPLSSSAVTIAYRSINEIAVEPVQLEQLRITGHVGSFEYGYDPETKKSTKVVTGYESW
tara:strand:+ start:512 stop:769 length:258 start_codon:yes stop_codon:yes gene_type:complete